MLCTGIAGCIFISFICFYYLFCLCNFLQKLHVSVCVLYARCVVCARAVCAACVVLVSELCCVLSVVLFILFYFILFLFNYFVCIPLTTSLDPIFDEINYFFLSIPTWVYS